MPLLEIVHRMDAVVQIVVAADLEALRLSSWRSQVLTIQLIPPFAQDAGHK
jgi:hypothetical protein